MNEHMGFTNEITETGQVVAAKRSRWAGIATRAGITLFPLATGVISLINRPVRETVTETITQDVQTVQTTASDVVKAVTFWPKVAVVGAIGVGFVWAWRSGPKK